LSGFAGHVCGPDQQRQVGRQPTYRQIRGPGICQ
jgi:hypothetical protein